MPTKKKKHSKQFESVIAEVQYHYQKWTSDRDTRMNRDNGWNDVIDAYFGRLPDNWPYLSTVIDPRLRTTILEKKARLTNSKLRGRVAPREGSDLISAKINNSLLDFQWDNAQDGGSMNYKWGMMDQDCRLFASSFALVTWKYEVDEDGEVIFNGNEFKPLDVRNVGILNGDNVQNTKWVQVSEYLTIDELEYENDLPGMPKYPGLKALKAKMSEGAQDRRDSNYQSRLRSLKGLEDSLGDDDVFPVIEVVTEYRVGRWITFAPRFDVVLRDIDNPYDHGKIPIVQLKYYPLSDDPHGESEVESVLPLWRSIQYVLNGFLDTMNTHMKPPLKVLEGEARMETITWGPDAVWVMDRPEAITEHSGSGEPMRYFQTTYSALIAAFNTAMGDSSQSAGGIDPFNPDKTATEIKKIERQQNVRDQDNQSVLSDAIKLMMSMWMSNNTQFLFADPKMHEYIVKIIGEKDFAFFKRAGLADSELTDNSVNMMKDIIDQRDGDISDGQLQQLATAGEVPKFPVFTNPNEKDPDKIEMKPQLEIDDTGTEASLAIIPKDVNGTYDYIPDVKSMSAGASQEMGEARQRALELLTGNQLVIKLLAEQGFRPNVKELLSEVFEDAGTKDAERFFSNIQDQQAQGAGQNPQAPAGIGQDQQQQGLPGLPQAAPQPGQQMAGPPIV